MSIEDVAPQRVHMVSLGCPKNRVDSEVMAGTLRDGPFVMVDDPADADVIIVNTCAFIEPATQESVDTVLELAQYKDAGRARKLVVTGCMVQRYGKDLEEQLPEVDHFLGTGEYHRIAQVLQARDEVMQRSWIERPTYLHDERTPRVNSWAGHSAYLKIGEGCDHTCSFCIIPQLRGKLRSRTVSSLVVEATRLVEQGVVELNLVSQDSTAYGRDLRDGTDLGVLLGALGEIDGLSWIRVHYAYPHGLPESFLEQLAHNPKVCKYLDIPLQHASGRMLRAMRRGVTRSGQEKIIERIRRAVPDIALRTTFIAGFPGETDEDFAELCDFVATQRFDHVGVFPYWREDGTGAAELEDQVPDDVRAERRDELMRIQSEISAERLARLIGQVRPVMVEGVSAESEMLLAGRLESQAPEVDGQVYLTAVPAGVRAGQIIDVRFTQAATYDLVGEAVPPGQQRAAELA